MSEEKIEITVDDLYGAAVDTRIRGLMSALESEYQKANGEIRLGTNGLPFILLTYEDGAEVLLSYYPVDEVDDEHFLLFVRSTLSVEEAADTSYILSCESYNTGAPFGFAVYDPAGRAVELRAQIPEIGGLSEAEYYTYLLDLFMHSRDELNDFLTEE